MKNILSIITFFIIGCTLNSSGTWKNENIDPSVSEEIHSLNRLIIAAFLHNEPERIYSIAGEALKKQTNEKELANIVYQVSQALVDDEITIIDEYYVSNSTNQASNMIIGDNYKLSYIAANNEIFASLLEINIRPKSSLMMGLIYGKYQDGWKLNICQIGEYKYPLPQQVTNKKKSCCWLDALHRHLY